MWITYRGSLPVRVLHCLRSFGGGGGLDVCSTKRGRRIGRENKYLSRGGGLLLFFVVVAAPAREACWGRYCSEEPGWLPSIWGNHDSEPVPYTNARIRGDGRARTCFLKSRSTNNRTYDAGLVAEPSSPHTRSGSRRGERRGKGRGFLFLFSIPHLDKPDKKLNYRQILVASAAKEPQQTCRRKTFQHSTGVLTESCRLVI